MILNEQILLLEKLSNKKVVLVEDTIFKPTHLTDNRHEKYKQKIFQILQQEVIEDNLDLNGLDFITDLGNVKLVKGDLWLQNTLITSLPEGLIVEEYLWLEDTPISKNLKLLEKYKKLYKIIV